MWSLDKNKFPKIGTVKELIETVYERQNRCTGDRLWFQEPGRRSSLSVLAIVSLDAFIKHGRPGSYINVM